MYIETAINFLQERFKQRKKKKLCMALFIRCPLGIQFTPRFLDTSVKLAVALNSTIFVLIHSFLSEQFYKNTSLKFQEQIKNKAEAEAPS